MTAAAQIESRIVWTDRKIRTEQHRFAAQIQWSKAMGEKTRFAGVMDGARNRIKQTSFVCEVGYRSCSKPSD